MLILKSGDGETEKSLLEQSFICSARNSQTERLTVISTWLLMVIKGASGRLHETLKSILLKTTCISNIQVCLQSNPNWFSNNILNSACDILLVCVWMITRWCSTKDLIDTLFSTLTKTDKRWTYILFYTESYDGTCDLLRVLLLLLLRFLLSYKCSVWKALGFIRPDITYISLSEPPMIGYQASRWTQVEVASLTFFMFFMYPEYPRTISLVVVNQ